MNLNSTVSEYSPEEYLEEKEKGLRLPNGAKPLKRLTAQHRQILQMHLSGLSNNKICEETGKTPATISRIINDPLAQKEILSKIADYEEEFQALFPKSVEVLREAMEANTVQNTPAHSTRLKAVDTFYKASGRYKNAEDDRESAEDVIQRILKNPLVNIQIQTDPSKVSRIPQTYEGELDGDDNTD